MSKAISSFELSLKNRPEGRTLHDWIYGELRRAILDGLLAPGTRLPASRDFADQYGLSRGTVVSVLERLQSEGYLSCRVGLGTWVNHVAVPAPPRTTAAPPAYIQRIASEYRTPKPWAELPFHTGVRPFRIGNPDADEFPSEIWGRLAADRARNFRSWIHTEPDGSGYLPLREAIAAYLRASRGVRCGAEQVMLVSGIQQALDLLGRFLLQPHRPIWMEDPGYFGATIAFNNAGAKIVGVPVDDEGLSVSAGKRICSHAAGAYVTPAHQFPMGVTMSLERRMALLHWASNSGAFVIEDDYDSEYRFEGQPVPALQSLDTHSTVIFIGSFSKTLFTSLRIGYIVLPPSLVDFFRAFRYKTDFRNSTFDQAVLCDFITGGHLARHLRRMRNLYAGRLTALMQESKQHLEGVLDLSDVRAGLYTIGYLRNGMGSRQAEKLAAEAGIEVLAADRYTLARPDPKAILLGFAAYDEAVIRRNIIRLAKALRVAA